MDNGWVCRYLNSWARKPPTEISLPTALCVLFNWILNCGKSFKICQSHFSRDIREWSSVPGLQEKPTSLCAALIVPFLWGHWAYSRPITPCKVNKKGAALKMEQAWYYIYSILPGTWQSWHIPDTAGAIWRSSDLFHRATTLEVEAYL